MSLKENISKCFVQELGKHKKVVDVDTVDGVENSSDVMYLNVPTDDDRLKLCHDFQERKIESVTKLLIKERKPTTNKFASLKKYFKNGNNKENKKSSVRQFVQKLSSLVTVEHREKIQVNKKIKNIFARLRRTKSKSNNDENDGASVIGMSTDETSLKTDKIILADDKQLLSKIDEISDAIKEYLEENQLGDLNEEKLNEFMKELVDAYIP